MPVALITGCSSGIGRALADAFKAAGYEVWASARKAEDVALLASAGFTAVQLDVNDSTALEQLGERINLQHGGLDVLINNAGYGAMGPLLDGGEPGSGDGRDIFGFARSGPDFVAGGFECIGEGAANAAGATGNQRNGHGAFLVQKGGEGDQSEKLPCKRSARNSRVCGR